MQRLEVSGAARQL